MAGTRAKNCLIHAPDRLVVLLGIDDAVVVDTPDALLVGDSRRSQEVRDLVDALIAKAWLIYDLTNVCPDSSTIVNTQDTPRAFSSRRPVVLLDRKDREYLARLDQRRAIAIRGGKIAIEEIIGHEEGSVVRSSVNEPFLVFRPVIAAADSKPAAQRTSDLSQRPRTDPDLGGPFAGARWSKRASAPAP